MNLVPYKHLFIIALFQSTKFRKQELCVDNKVRETIGDVYFPTCRKENVFTFQPMKRLISTTVKSAKPTATLSIFLLGTRNRQLCCLVVMDRIVLQERRVAITKKKLSPFLKEFLHQTKSPPPKRPN